MTKAQKVYNLLQEKCGSNEIIQAISGALGFPATLLVDGTVIFTHYRPMINQIRNIYGLEALTLEVLTPVLEGCKSEILKDIFFDKLVGQIPLIGIGANIICAKVMTWRMGLLFAWLSVSDEEISKENVEAKLHMIRKRFPQKGLFKFNTPALAEVKKLLEPVDDNRIVSKLLRNLE